MTRIIALTALAALGLSGEPFHAGDAQVPHPATVRNIAESARWAVLPAVADPAVVASRVLGGAAVDLLLDVFGVVALLGRVP